jgi:DNA-binding transcriptional LysR family regulator
LIDSKCQAAVRALARHSSFREAAQAIGTSPASFSRYIVQAETYATRPLFERRRNGAQLTSAGREFLRLLDDLDRATNVFESGVERLKGYGSDILNIGCGPLTSRTLIAPLLEHLLATIPDVRIKVTVSATKEPLEALRRGELDVAICDLTHTTDLSDLLIQVVRKEQVSFWARPEHPLHAKGPVSMTEIFAQPLLSPHIHKHWRAAVAQGLGGDKSAWETVERLPKVESCDFALLLELARKSDLICVGMHETVAEHTALGLLKKVQTNEQLDWNICAARRIGHTFPALEAFWDAAVEKYGISS